MITGVALFNPQWQMLITLPKPHRHCDLFRMIKEATGHHLKPDTGWVQGFVNYTGKFLDREEAAIYLLKNPQPLTDYAKKEYENRRLKILFSEDLW